MWADLGFSFYQNRAALPPPFPLSLSFLIMQTNVTSFEIQLKIKDMNIVHMLKRPRLSCMKVS